MLGHPPGYSLSEAQFQVVQQFLVRVLGSPQYQVGTLQHINETRITFDDLDGELQYTLKYLVESIRRGDTADGVVQNIDMGIFNMDRGSHKPTLSAPEAACPIAIFDGSNKAKPNFNSPEVNWFAMQLTLVTQLITVNMQAVAVGS